jgi:hypothetical protein
MNTPYYTKLESETREKNAKADIFNRVVTSTEPPTGVPIDKQEWVIFKS